MKYKKIVVQMKDELENKRTIIKHIIMGKLIVMSRPIRRPGRRL